MGFEPLPHVNELPMEPVTRIRLKDPNHTIKSCNNPCPRKWKEAWHTLLRQHLDAGQIHPSSAPAGCGAFIIPKADPTVLPQWVNDYHQLNMNTVTDSFPILLVNEILSDCAQGKIFATLDMTNSFFQTRMHPDDIALTAVNTPWGLYEWVVMPMGIKNARQYTSVKSPQHYAPGLESFATYTWTTLLYGPHPLMYTCKMSQLSYNHCSITNST